MPVYIKKRLLPLAFLPMLLICSCSTVQQAVTEPCHVQLKFMPGFDLLQLTEILSSFDVVSVQWHPATDVMGSSGTTVVELTLKDKSKLSSFRNALTEHALNVQSLNSYSGY